MSTKVISLGSICQVKHNIDQYFGPSETNLFDWIITDFRTVLQIFNDFEGNLFKKEKFTRDNILMEIYPHMDKFPFNKFEHKEMKFISIHDFNGDHQNFELSIDGICEKFLRRLNRLKEIILNTENIHFVHVIDHSYLPEYIPSLDDINEFFSLVRNINSENNINLHILVAPIHQNLDFSHLVRENLHIHNFKIINNNNDWIGSNFNWGEIFYSFNH